MHARSNHEETARAVPAKDVQDGWCALGMRAVIKSQQNGVSLCSWKLAGCQESLDNEPNVHGAT